MKMRKILSFVLVLSLVLGSFSMAFAATPATNLSDIAGIANEDAVQVNADLGIINGFPDGTFKPEQMVTRAEFAAMMTRALAIPESALAGYTSTTFKDTAGYGWAVPYLAFCQSKGIMIGDGFGNAMPGRTINVNEAMTMVLRAIGYVNHSAELVGTWPSNYVTVAQNVGLYDDVAAVATVDRASAAQIIYNALTVQKVAVNADGETKYLDNGKTGNDYVAYTLLNTGLKSDPSKGVMGVDFGSDAVMNVQKYMGQYGTAYLNSDDEVVAFIADSTQLVGKFVAGSTDFDDNFKTLSGDTYTNNTTTTGIAYMKNGVVDTVAFDAGLTTVYTINAEVSGKRIVEIHSVMLWDVTADDKVSASDLEAIEDDQSLLGYDFTLDDDDEIDMKSFALVGAKSLSDIKADNVVYVYTADSEITRIEVGTKTVDGLVQSFKDSKATIAGTAYKNAGPNVNGLANNDNVSGDEVSYNVSASLDVNGYVYTFDVTDDVANNVAVLLATDSGINYQAKLKIADDSSKVYTVKNAIVFGQLPVAEGLLVYGLNTDGEISSVTDGGLSVVLTVGSEFASTKVVSVSGGATYRISSDVVVFEATSTGYNVISIADVEKAEPTTVAGELLLNDTNVVIGIIVDTADAKATADDVYGVVNEQFFDTNADGDKVYKLVGFADGSAFEKFTDSDSTVLSAAWNGNTFATIGGVQLYKMEIDSDGVVTAGTTTFTGSTPLVTDATVSAVDARVAVKVNATTWYALADDVVIYEFIPADDEYKVYTGKLVENWKVTIFELDSDNNGAEVVFFTR